MMTNKQTQLAVLIDANNTSASAARDIMSAIAKLGVASAKRIYGDWRSAHLKEWQENLLPFALTPIQQFAYATGKNATDMQLTIDAMDLLYSNTFDGFCIISSDSDFTPLVIRIRERGIPVFGFGRKTTPEAFRQACDRFFLIEHLQSEHTRHQTNIEQILPQPIEGALRHLLYKAIKDATDDTTGWAFLGHIGQHLKQTQSDFVPRSYGYATLSTILKAMGELQFKNDGVNRMYCRKTPYADIIKLLDKAVNNFQNKQGWAKKIAVEKFIKPRWDYTAYGFEDFELLLETLECIEVGNDSIRMKFEEKA